MRNKTTMAAAPKWKSVGGTSMSIMAAVTCNLMCLLLMAGQAPPTAARNQHSILILMGGTGDLAAKYLWKGIFDVYRSHSDLTQVMDEKSSHSVNYTFDFIAGGRTKQDKGNLALNEILMASIRCPDEDESDSPRAASLLCEKQKSEFLDKISYVSLQNEEDFSWLCSELITKFSHSSASTRKELILFMAIPPAAYEQVLYKFNEKCHAVREENIRIKLALEKPFGVDKASAEQISEKVLSLYGEEEIYRIDHYLGKPVVKSVLPFRYLNPNIEKILNKDHVEKVEIFLKETVGVDDRFEFYNGLGVLRDIHQNHLTQLLTLVAMDLPSDLDDTVGINKNKERLLRQVETVHRHNSLFGQYAGYGAKIKGQDQNSTNDVPTFAASVVKINSPRWRTVPFLLVSGKQLDTRESYIRIVFKNNYVCVSHCADSTLDEERKFTKQIVFHIGHGSVVLPSILVSKSLSEPDCPEDFQESIDPKLFSSPVVYGEHFKHFFACTVMQDTPAYVSVFSDLLAGRQDNFVSTRQLLLSWHVWDYLVGAPKKIRIYEPSDSHGHLNFIIKERVLEFVHNDEEVQESVEDQMVIIHSEVMHEYMQLPAMFMGHKLITSQTDHLAFVLAKEIDHAADMDIQAKGSFHVAFSGGASMPKVLQMLAQQFANIHWHSIHVWQVDERCVPHQDERSNFQMLDRELLRFVDIPYTNIHSMPVYAGGRLCDPDLGGPHAYADAIRHVVPNSQFDFVVLGLGMDGHTASLFPASSDLHVDSNTFVVTTEDGPVDTRRRMTLTLPILNKARRVAIIVTGKHKRDIVNKVESNEGRSVDTYPVLGVNPVNGTLTWFMDYAAFTGA